MKLERLGQLVKVKLPQLQYVPDEELGLAYYNLKLRKPFPKPTTGGFLAPLRIWLLGKQDSWVEAQFQHDLREEEREHIALYAPLQRQQTEENRQAQHHAETEQHLLTAGQCAVAREENVDLPTLYQMQLKREEHKLQLEASQKMAEIEIWKQQQLNEEHIRQIRRAREVMAENEPRGHRKTSAGNDPQETATEDTDIGADD